MTAPLAGLAGELRRLDAATRLPRYRGAGRVVLCCETDDYTAPRGVDVYTGARVIFSSMCAAGLGPGKVCEGLAYLVDGDGVPVAPMLGGAQLHRGRELDRLLADAGAGRLRPAHLVELRRRLHLVER